VTLKLSTLTEEELLALTAALMGEQERRKALPNFSKCLANAIETTLSHLRAPVFTNPTTGKASASLCSILISLDYHYPGHWSSIAAFFKRKGGSTVFERRDLEKSSSSWPTVCVDLDAFEDIALKFQPRKAKKVISEFKKENGLAA